MDFSHNSISEIFFVDGAESTLTRSQKETLSSAAAHLLECFQIDDEVDVYISKKSILHKVAGVSAQAWHSAPQYNRENHIVCVFVDPEESLKGMIISLAHEMIHAWQVYRGDLLGTEWKQQDYSNYSYKYQPWEIEAHGFMEQVAGFYFEDRHPGQGELNLIKEKTDNVVQEVDKMAGNEQLKSTLKKAAKVAGLVGLGALLGG